MRKRVKLFVAASDPLLAAQLNQIKDVTVLNPGCELPADCLEQVTTSESDAVLLSPALAPWPGAVTSVVQELRNRLPQAAIAIACNPGQIAPADVQGLQNAGAVLLPGYEYLQAHVEAWLRGEAPHLTPVPQQPPTGGYPIKTLPVIRQESEPQSPRMAPPLLQRAAPESAGPPQSKRSPVPAPPQILRQKIVAFWGGKAGGGRSTLVTAAADVISQIPGVRVCTVDLNPYGSSLAALLQKESEPNSWASIGPAVMYGALTSQAVREGIVPVSPQWGMVTSPAGSEQWCGMLTDPVIAHLLDILRADYDYILLDLPAGRTPSGDAGLAAAQQVLLVVSAFFPDVVDTTRIFEQALSDGIVARERCQLVLSPWADSAELPAGDVSRCLGLPVSAKVPLCPIGALTAARKGSPVTRLGGTDAKPLADAAQAVARLIADATAAHPQRRSWFGR